MGRGWPRAAHLLVHLASNAGTPVSRNDLMAEVWPNLVVGGEALTGAINKLRKAFEDDSSHPEVIETIPKVGYRLITEVEFLSSESAIDPSRPVASAALSKPTANR